MLTKLGIGPFVIFFWLLSTSVLGQQRNQGLFLQPHYGSTYFQTWPERCKEDAFICVPAQNGILAKVGVTIGWWNHEAVHGIRVIYYYNAGAHTDPGDVIGLEFREIWQLSYVQSYNFVATRIFKSPVEFALNLHVAPGFYYYKGIEKSSNSESPPFQTVRWYTGGLGTGIEIRLGFRSGPSKVMTYFEPVNVAFTTRTFSMGIKGGLVFRF